MYSGQISQDFQTVHNVDHSQGSHDRHVNAATLSDWASKLITLLLDQVEDRWKLRNEALHGRDRAEYLLFHRAIICAEATRLYTCSSVGMISSRINGSVAQGLKLHDEGWDTLSSTS
jgi:hypothetical protein